MSARSPFRSHLLQQWTQSRRSPIVVQPWLQQQQQQQQQRQRQATIDEEAAEGSAVVSVSVSVSGSSPNATDAPRSSRTRRHHQRRSRGSLHHSSSPSSLSSSLSLSSSNHRYQHHNTQPVVLVASVDSHPQQQVSSSASSIAFATTTTTNNNKSSSSSSSSSRFAAPLDSHGINGVDNLAPRTTTTAANLSVPSMSRVKGKSKDKAKGEPNKRDPDGTVPLTTVVSSLHHPFSTTPSVRDTATNKAADDDDDDNDDDDNDRTDLDLVLAMAIDRAFTTTTTTTTTTVRSFLRTRMPTTRMPTRMPQQQQQTFSFRRLFAASPSGLRLLDICFEVALRQTRDEALARIERNQWLAVPAFLVTLVHNNQDQNQSENRSENRSEAAAVTAAVVETEDGGEEEEDPYEAMEYSPPVREGQLEDTPAFRSLVRAEPTDRIAALILVNNNNNNGV
eukprot:jgi/Psemu1/16470/gm1.16470_g